MPVSPAVAPRPAPPPPGLTSAPPPAPPLVNNLMSWPGPGPLDSPSVLIAAAVAGVVAAIALPWDRPGVGWLLTALVAAGATLVGAAARGDRSARAAGSTPAIEPSVVPPRRGSVLPVWVRAMWALLALLLIAVGTVRAAGWLFVLCVLGALLAAAQAVVGGRSVLSMVVATFGFPVAAVRGVFWAVGGAVVARGRSAGAALRTAAAVAVGLVLLLIFGALLAAADAAFASTIDRIVPTINGGVLFRWVFFFVLI
ncbi:MAG: DUF4153 domain-containing protein, partial [Micromonosporaceae bacterium]